ncbi:MAG: type 1 glutamine amidotransferase [Halobacteria archaeon]
MKQWLKETIRKGYPVLGICFGCQLIADVLGGKITSIDKSEVGYRYMTRTRKKSRILDGLPTNFLAFEHHGDKITELPLGAELLARDKYPVEAFRWRQTFGVQFHPEASAEIAAKTATEQYPNQSNSTLRRRATENYKKSKQVQKVFRNFIEYVDEYSHEDNQNVKLPPEVKTNPKGQIK